MKKTLLFLSTAFALSAFGQSSLLITNTSNSVALAPNDTIYVTVAANSNIKVILDLKNTSSSTKSYKVTRNDVLLNTGASAYFCFGGGCYPDITTTSPDADTLTPGQSASQAQGTFKMLTTDLDEGPVAGKSIVEYTFFNTDDTKDNVKIIIKYNYAKPVGIKENIKIFTAFDVFPNPAKESTCLSISSTKQLTSSVVLLNSLGEVVYQKEIVVVEGRNKFYLSFDGLYSGVYFAKIKMGDSFLVKKIIID